MPSTTGSSCATRPCAKPPPGKYPRPLPTPIAWRANSSRKSRFLTCCGHPDPAPSKRYSMKPARRPVLPQSRVRGASDLHALCRTRSTGCSAPHGRRRCQLVGAPRSYRVVRQVRPRRRLGLRGCPGRTRTHDAGQNNPPGVQGLGRHSERVCRFAARFSLHRDLDRARALESAQTDPAGAWYAALSTYQM